MHRFLNPILSFIFIIFFSLYLSPLKAWADDAKFINYSRANDFSFTRHHSYFSDLKGLSFHIGWIEEQFSNHGTSFATDDLDRSFNIHTDYHPGFVIGLKYEFPQINSSLSADVTHINKRDRSKAWGDTLWINPEYLGPATWATSRLLVNFDRLDVTFKEAMQVTPYFGMSYGAGVGYLHFKRAMTTNTWGFDNTFQTHAGISFDGAGPIFDFAGYFSPIASLPEVNIFGGFDPAIFFGSLRGFVRTNINDFVHSDHIPREDIAIPSMGAKLGLSYNFRFSDMKYNIQLGYQVHEYFDLGKDTNYTTSINSSMQGFFLTVGMEIM